MRRAALELVVEQKPGAGHRLARLVANDAADGDGPFERQRRPLAAMALRDGGRQ